MSEFAVERARQIIQARRAAQSQAVSHGGPEGRKGMPAVTLPAETAETIEALSIMYARIRQFDDWLRHEYRLNLTELHVLLALSSASRPVPREAASRLAEDVGLSPSGLTRLVARLVDRGLLFRERDPWDKRVTRLALTDHGRQVRHTVLPRAAEHIRDSCGGQQSLLERLRRIAEGPARGRGADDGTDREGADEPH